MLPLNRGKTPQGSSEGRQYKTGFPALADRLAACPDYEGFVFRRFDRVSAQNLLHLESKLAYLEWKLDQSDYQAIHIGDNETLRSIRTWEAFEETARDKSRPENIRMKIIGEIEETLAKYRTSHHLPDGHGHRVNQPKIVEDALVRQHQIATLASPEDRVLEVLRSQSLNLTAGFAAKRLDEANRRDLVAVRRPAENDLLSRLLQNHWIFKVLRSLPPKS